MKNILSLIGIILLSHTTKAQSIYVQGGVNFANISKTESGRVEKNNILTTLNAGLTTSFKLSSIVSLEPGILFSGKGAKAKTTFTDNSYVSTKFNPYYIEVPVNITFNLPLDLKSKIFVYAGPYAAIGVGGKSISDLVVGNLTTTVERKIEYDNDNPFTSEQEDAAYYKLKRFDYGINVGAGLMLSNFKLMLNYGHGLAKINSTQSDNNINDKNKYRTLSLSLGIPLSGF